MIDDEESDEIDISEHADAMKMDNNDTDDLQNLRREEEPKGIDDVRKIIQYEEFYTSQTSSQQQPWQQQTNTAGLNSVDNTPGGNSTKGRKRRLDGAYDESGNEDLSDL